MSDTWTDEDLDEILGNAGDNSTIKVLRDKIKADNATIKQMQGQINQLQTANREPMVKGALKSAGLTENAYKGYTGEADPNAIQAWVEANKDWIAPAGAQPQGLQTIEPEIPTGPPVEPVSFTPDAQMQYQRMLSAGVDGVPGSNFTETLGGLQGAKSMEELMQVIMNSQ